MKRMLLWLLLLGAVIAAGSVAETSPAQARRLVEGPWCANYTFGIDGIEADCSYASVEACRPHVVAGNRGYCGLNPRWVDLPPPLRHRRRVDR